MRKTIWKFTVNRASVGVMSPFPLLYFFREEQLSDFRAVFETFIGFPVRHYTQILWKDIIVQTEKEPAIGDSLFRTIHDFIPDLNSPEPKWHVAVPILTFNVLKSGSQAYGRDGLPKRGFGDPMELRQGQHPFKETDRKPTLHFLIGASWKNWHVERSSAMPKPRAAYPENAYLSSRDGITAPLCDACPRALRHELGHCHVGDAICFDSLREFSADNRMFNRISAYKERKEQVDSPDQGDV